MSVSNEFQAEETQILAVALGLGHAPENLGAKLPFPLVTYPDRGIDGKTPAIYVLDRYGEEYAAYRPDDLNEIPTADDLLEWLRFIELQCPGRGISEWVV